MSGVLERGQRQQANRSGIGCPARQPKLERRARANCIAANRCKVPKSFGL